jgi:hypothetical protein
MAVWEELRVVLARLRDQQPGALMQFPTLEVDEGGQPPLLGNRRRWLRRRSPRLLG